MAIFFGLPSLLVYLGIFGAFRLTLPPAWIAIPLGLAIPAIIVLGFYSWRGVEIDLSPKNWVLWMGVIGGFAGTLTHLYICAGNSPPA